MPVWLEGDEGKWKPLYRRILDVEHEISREYKYGLGDMTHKLLVKNHDET